MDDRDPIIQELRELVAPQAAEIEKLTENVLPRPTLPTCNGPLPRNWTADAFNGYPMCVNSSVMLT